MKDPKNNKALEGNINKTCLITFVDGMWFPFPVFILFFMAHGISMTQVGLILGASYAVSLLLDIPSSIWADKYSRKSILLIGNLSFALLNLVIYLFDSFGAFFLAFCLNGIGTACWTGIFSAFIYDTLLSLKKEGQYARVQAKFMKCYFAGRLIASISGVYLYGLDPKLPFLLSAIANLVCVLLALSFREPLREKSISKSLIQVREGLGYLSRKEGVWNVVIIFSLVGGIWDALFNYYQIAMQSSGIPLEYFSIVYVFVSIAGFLGAGLYHRISSKVDYRAIMLSYLAIDFFAALFFGSGVAVLVVAAIAFLTFASGSFDIYIGSIIHKSVPSSHRATALSVRNQMYMLFSLVLINLINFITDHSTLMVGMLSGAAIVLIAALSFVRSHYRAQEAAVIKPDF